MQLYSDSFPNNGLIPVECAFAQIDEKTRVRLSNNKNPHLAWTDVPAGTQSFVVLCVDAHAPTDPADVNQIDREVPADLPRADFVHWVLINIPADVQVITEGQFSHEVTPRGKSGPMIVGKGFKDSPMRQGINDNKHSFTNHNE